MEHTRRKCDYADYGHPGKRLKEIIGHSHLWDKRNQYDGKQTSNYYAAHYAGIKIAYYARAHNDANILSFPVVFVRKEITEILEVF